MSSQNQKAHAAALPKYVPPAPLFAPMPSHSATPPNPSNPALKVLEEQQAADAIPDEINPAVAPNPTMAMSKAVDLPSAEGLPAEPQHDAATDRTSAEPVQPATAKLRRDQPAKKAVTKGRATAKSKPAVKSKPIAKAHRKAA